MQRVLYVVALLIAVVLSVVSPVAFQAQVVPSPTPPVEIISASNGMCLQPINNSTQPGVNNSTETGQAIIQEPCTGLPEQMWVWTLPNGDTGWIWGLQPNPNDTPPPSIVPMITHLMNGLSGLCMDARGRAAEGTPVQQWQCDLGEKVNGEMQISNENWEAGISFKGSLESLVSGPGKYCLGTGGKNSPGAAMHIYSCNNSAAQIWQFQALTPPPLAPPPIEISSGLSGMCLQPMNKSLEPGAAIVQQACTGFAEQIWFWTSSNGVTHLMNGLSGLCLDARGKAADTTPVQQWTCDQISNENWEAVGTSNKEILKSRVSNTSDYCLAVPEGDTTPGAAMWIFSCKDTASQTWHFQAQAPPPGTLAPPAIEISSGSLPSGMCLQPMNKSTAPGAAIVQQTCTGFPEQIWIWVTLPNGVSHLMNGLSGLCLDARGTAQNTTQVQQWPCDQISNENWEAAAAAGTPDKQILKSRVSNSNNYCLDVPGGSSPGLTAQINSCSGSISQMWQLGGQSTVVPNVFGSQAVPNAAMWIEGFSLVPQLQLPASMSMCNANTAGRVVGQFPAAGTPALRNSAVTLYFCPSS